MQKRHVKPSGQPAPSARPRGGRDRLGGRSRRSPAARPRAPADVLRAQVGSAGGVPRAAARAHAAPCGDSRSAPALPPRLSRRSPPGRPARAHLRRAPCPTRRPAPASPPAAAPRKSCPSAPHPPPAPAPSSRGGAAPNPAPLRAEGGGGPPCARPVLSVPRRSFCGRWRWVSILMFQFIIHSFTR